MPMRDGAVPRGWVICVPILIGIPACSLGPTYHRPDVTLPAAWSTQSGPAAPDAAAPPAAAEPATDWWKGFGSSQLDDYIARAQNANDDIGAAMARILE